MTGMRANAISGPVHQKTFHPVAVTSPTAMKVADDGISASSHK